MRVTKTDIIFSARGGERSTPHGLDIPEGAEDIRFDDAESEVIYTLPPVDGVGDPTTHKITITASKRTEALAAINAPRAPVVPEFVKPRQIRLALIDRGIKPSQILARLEAIEEEELREKTLVEWEFAEVVRRDSPIIADLAEAFNINNNQLNALFINAQRL